MSVAAITPAALFGSTFSPGFKTVGSASNAFNQGTVSNPLGGTVANPGATPGVPTQSFSGAMYPITPPSAASLVQTSLQSFQLPAATDGLLQRFVSGTLPGIMPYL